MDTNTYTCKGKTTFPFTNLVPEILNEKKKSGLTSYIMLTVICPEENWYSTKICPWVIKLFVEAYQLKSITLTNLTVVGMMKNTLNASVKQQ